MKAPDLASYRVRVPACQLFQYKHTTSSSSLLLRQTTPCFLWHSDRLATPRGQWILPTVERTGHSCRWCEKEVAKIVHCGLPQLQATLVSGLCANGRDSE